MPRREPTSTPPRRRLRWMAAAALVVLFAGEAAARALDPYLPEPLVYGDETTQVKVAQLDALADRCVDVVLAGDSMGRDAFAPAVFTGADTSGRVAYNASLDGASPSLLRRWLTEQVVPRVHPSTVVLAVSSLDLNQHANAAAAALDAYDHAPMTANGFTGRVSSWFVGHSVLVRDRTELRDPAILASAVSSWRDGTPPTHRAADAVSGLIGPAGEGLSRRSLHYQHDVATKSFTRDQLLAGYAIDDRQVADTRQLLDDLRATGIDVAIVVLPVTADYIALHPRGQADFDSFLSRISMVASDAGVPIIDLHARQPDDREFADTHHLNGDGQTWFSAALPDELAAAGVPPARHCG